MNPREQRRLRDAYGPWAVVTGATDGIGREFARSLAAAGINVVLVARGQERLDALAIELSTEHHAQAAVIAADLSTPAGVETLLEHTRAFDVGLLVACAGFGTSGPFIDSILHDELAMIDTNCRSVVWQCHEFARRFRERGRGGIVLMSSLLAFQGVPRAANYAATKAFIQSFAEGLRYELHAVGVDVVASAPGPVHSGFAARASMTMSVAVDANVVATETLKALGRHGTVRAGWLSKGLEASLKMLPRVGRVRIMSAVMSGMTKRRE